MADELCWSRCLRIMPKRRRRSWSRSWNTKLWRNQMHVHCVCAELNMQKNIVRGSDAQYDFERCTYRLSVLPCTEFITIWIVRIQGLFEYVYVRLCVCNDLYCHALSNDTQRQVAGYSAGAYRHCLFRPLSLTQNKKRYGARTLLLCARRQRIHPLHTHTHDNQRVHGDSKSDIRKYEASWCCPPQH